MVLVGHLDDAGDDAVHEIAVMAGHEQRALEFAGQPVFQPDDRLHVQMVGGLVQQQHIGVEGQDLGQGDAHLPAAAEGFHRAVVVVRADAEAGEHGLGPDFQVVAAAVLELLHAHRRSARAAPPSHHPPWAAPMAASISRISSPRAAPPRRPRPSPPPGPSGRTCRPHPGRSSR